MLLHAGAAVAIAAMDRADAPSAPPERGVEIVWQDVAEDSAPGDEAAAAPGEPDPAGIDGRPRAEPGQDAVEAPPFQQVERPQPPEPARPAEEPQAPTGAAVPDAETSPPPPAEQAASPEAAEAPLPPPLEQPAPPDMAEAPPLPEAMGARPAPLEEPAQPELPSPPPSRQTPAGRSAAAPPEAPGGSRATGAVSAPGLLEGFRNPEPEYPATSRERGDQGIVTVRLQISETGEVTAVEVIATSGHPALDDSARRAVQRWRFRPATRDGVAVPGSVRTAIHFRLQR